VRQVLSHLSSKWPPTNERSWHRKDALDKVTVLERPLIGSANQQSGSSAERQYLGRKPSGHSR